MYLYLSANTDTTVTVRQSFYKQINIYIYLFNRLKATRLFFSELHLLVSNFHTILTRFKYMVYFIVPEHCNCWTRYSTRCRSTVRGRTSSRSWSASFEASAGRGAWRIHVCFTALGVGLAQTESKWPWWRPNWPWRSGFGPWNVLSTLKGSGGAWRVLGVG